MGPSRGDGPRRARYRNYGRVGGRVEPETNPVVAQRGVDRVRITLRDVCFRRRTSTLMTVPEPTSVPLRADTSPAPERSFDSSSPTGEATEIGELYDLYAPELFRYSQRILQDCSRAEEAVQDTFVRAWKHAGLWDQRIGSRRTWLFSIAHNVCIDSIRARNARPPVTGGSSSEPAVSGEATLEAAMDGWLVEEALRRIRDDQRTAIVETYIRGRSYGEVAAATGVNEATLRSRVFYGLKALRIAMEELGWTA